jgi:hypothetical protein
MNSAYIPFGPRVNEMETATIVPSALPGSC